MMKYLVLIVALVLASCQMKEPKLFTPVSGTTERTDRTETKIPALGTFLGQLGGSWGISIYEFTYKDHTYLVSAHWIIEVK